MLVPPPYPDERDQHEAQINTYNLVDPLAISELGKQWEKEHEAAWRQSGRKRPQLCWWDIPSSDDS